MRKRECRKLISLLLILCMLLTAIPASAVPVELSEPEMTEVEQQTSALVEEPQLSTTAQILSEDCKILNYVHAEVFSSANHVARLTSEETLSSYVFLNEDGTRTAYFMDEAVKFVDANGIIQEKDLTLVPTVGGYTTEKNDIELTLPTDPSKGITLLWNNTAVRIIPQGGTVGEAVVEDNTVRYVDYYGNGADLVYTPTLSGLKEDIILESYAGKNTFTFMLNTGGLRLYSANGRYFLAASKTATERIELGDVVSFDTRGRFSVGTMTAQTVTAGQIYRLTLTVDEAFLTDPNTVYPVSIDPTLKVNDNNAAGSIEDVSIYQGKPTTNGNWTYLHSGYYDSNYTVSRTLFRLTGLIRSSVYQELNANQVSSAEFHIWEASGTATTSVHLRANAGKEDWSESGATWDGAGVVLGTIYDTQNLVSNSEATFDITQLVKNWKSGAVNAQKGFVLQSSNESSLDKAFYSSEHSNTARRPYVVLNYASLISLSCTSLTMYKNSTYTFTATPSSPGENITWSSSDQSVATFVSGGVLAAVREGTTVVTATNEDGYSASCIVYVRMANGVYRLQNQHSDLYLSVNTDMLTQSNNVTQQSLETMSSDSLQYYAQLWKIEYLANGFYSIRPMYSLGTGLAASGTMATTAEIGTTTSITAVPYSAQWTIRYDNGYVIQHAGMSSKTLLTPNNSSANGAKVELGHYYSMTTSNRWSIEMAESISDTLLLIDIENGTIGNVFTRYFAPNETRTLADMNIAVSFVSASTNSQAISISTSSNNITYSQSNESLTGNVPCTSSNVTFRILHNGVQYSRILVISVSAIPDGTYFVRNKKIDAYMQIDNNTSNMSANNNIMELHEFDGKNYQKWTFTLLEDGYYRIISKESNLALSVSSSYLNAADQALVQQFYTGADRQKWDIQISSSGSYILRPKSAESYATDWCMSAGTGIGTNGRNVEQRAYTNDTDYKDEWVFDTYALTLNLYHDRAFVVRHPDAQLLISEFVPELQVYFWEIFGVRLNINAAQQILSTPDMCKLSRGLTITNTTIDEICPANPILDGQCDYYNMNRMNQSICENCTSWYQIYRDFIDENAGDSVTVSVLFTGNALYDDDAILCNRSYHWYDNGIILQNIASSSDQYYVAVFSTFAHELSHAIGAKDHYHEMRENSQGVLICTGGENCIICHPDTGRPSWCLMGDHGRIGDPTNYDKGALYCDGCLNDMFEYLADHNISSNTGG